MKRRFVCLCLRFAGWRFFLSLGLLAIPVLPWRFLSPPHIRVFKFGHMVLPYELL